MDRQRFLISSRILDSESPRLQEALAVAYASGERPRCLCKSHGVEMYVARHREFVVKRMPGTGCRHHPQCAAYDADVQQSGLGELLGEAIVETSVGVVELRVDFPWIRAFGRGVAPGDGSEPGEIRTPQRRMSLRALTHFLFERAGLNRWVPAMAGKRHQGVIHKYILNAAAEMVVKGRPLTERLHVPEPFSEAVMAAAAQRRRDKLAVLQPRDGQTPLALVLGEFKACEPSAIGRRVWVKHMPDAPLLVTEKTWERAMRTYAPIFEVWNADSAHRPRMLLTALIQAKYEQIYQVEALSLMLTTSHWIPVDGAHDIALVHALIEQQRRFIKTLRYDARSAAEFPSAVLIDTGDVPVALHVVSAFWEDKERILKGQALSRMETAPWTWWTDAPMPVLPASQARR